MFFAAAAASSRLAATARAPCVAAACVVWSSSGDTRTRCDSSSSHAEPPPNTLRRRLTPIGRLSLYSETKANPSIGAAVLQLSGQPLGKAELAKRLDATLCASSFRFRSLLDETTGEFHDEDPDFSSAAVMTEVDKECDFAEVATLLLEPFAKDKPRWDVRLFFNAQQQRGTALLLRCHHALADGVSVGALLADVSDQADECRALVGAEVAKRRTPQRKKKSLLRKLKLLLLAACQFVVVLLRGLQALFAERPFRLKTAASPKRSVAWVHDFATVGDLKFNKNKATVNDVFAAIVAGGLATEHTTAKTVAAAFPIHLCGGVLPPGVDVGNNIGAVLCPLSLEVKDPLKHLALVSREVGATLRGGVAPVASYYFALFSVAVLPTAWLPVVLKSFSSAASAALTNVRGPPIALTICGRPVDDIVPFLPPPPGVPVGIALTTVAGKASLSVNADAAAFDAPALLDAILAHFYRLKHHHHQQQG